MTGPLGIESTEDSAQRCVQGARALLATLTDRQENQR